MVLDVFVVNWTSSWTNGRYTGHETQWRNSYITVMVHFGTMLLLTLNVMNFSWRIWNTVHNMSMHTAVLSFLMWCCQFLLHLIDLIIHISQGFLTAIGTIARLPQSTWRNPDGCEQIGKAQINSSAGEVTRRNIGKQLVQSVDRMHISRGVQKANVTYLCCIYNTIAKCLSLIP